MKKIFTSWLFFTSLMLLLLSAAVTLPGLMDGLFGDTEQQLQDATAYFQQQAQVVWNQFVP